MLRVRSTNLIFSFRSTSVPPQYTCNVIKERLVRETILLIICIILGCTTVVFVLDVYFAGIKNVAKADANGILSALTATINGCLQDTPWKKKVVALGSDGASIMLGRKNGLIAKLRELCDKDVMAVHCSGH